MFTKAVLVSALAISALAQSSYMTGLINVLNENGLTTLTSQLTSLNASALSAIETSINKGNHTLFTPNNEAFASVPDNIMSNVSYHVLSGLVTTNDTSPDKLTIARTNLTGAPEVNLRKFHLFFQSEVGLTQYLFSGQPASGYRT